MTERTSSQPLAEPPLHLSYSALNNLTQCGERYRLERGLGIKSQPSWAQVGGSAVHAASEEADLEGGEAGDLFKVHFEACIRDQEQRSDMPSTDFKATGRASKQYPNKEDRAWWEENGPLFVKNWIDWRRVSPWEPLVHNGQPAIELELNPTLGGVRVKMFVDRVFVTPAGEVVVLDLKSGASIPSGSLQLGVYKVGLEELLGVPVTYGTYWMARTNTTTPPEDLARWDRDYLDEIFWRGAKQIGDGVFIPTVDKHCGWCGVREFCRAAGGSRWQEAQGTSLV